MGRRAVPKLDPRVDFGGYLRALENLPTGATADTLFGRTAPLEIEIGSGKGLFLATAAELHPERLFLGNEISGKYARLIAYRLARKSLTNARIVHGDGLKLFREHLADQIADAVHVYFPDPWWKKRHRKRRVMQPSLIADIARVLRPGGRMHFWTDVEEYFEATCDLVRESVLFLGPITVAEHLAEHDMDYRTHFERRMRRTNQPVFRCQFEKPAQPAI